MTTFSVGDLVATLRVNETQFDQVMSAAPGKAKVAGEAIDKSMRGAKGALEGAAGGAASATNAIGAVAPASEKAAKAAQLAAAKMQDSYRTAGLGVSTVTASNAREWENAAATAESSGSRMGAAASRAGSMIGLAIGAGVVIAGKAILSLGMDYEVSLNTLQAVSGASAAKMGEVSAAAKALGNDLQVPGQSAADAASAMTALAKSGLSVDQAMGAAKATLQLATAAQISGAQAAEIQAGALQQFGLAASDANKVADVLANTANASSGEITDFAAGMSQAGLVAHGLGISLEDTATTLGIFANQGLRGSDAGTSLKTMLIALERPTTQQASALADLGVKAFDASGKFVGMKAIVDELGKAHGRMTTEQYNSAAATAFGTDAVRAATAIAAGGVTAFDSMATSVGKAGGAATLAAAQTKGVTGALGNFQNNLENIALTIYEKYAPAIESMLNSAAAALPAIGNFFMGTVGVVGKFVGLVTDIPGPVWALAAAFAAVAVLKGPVGAAFTGITSAITSFASHMDVARQSSVLMVNAGEKQLPNAMRTMATAAKSAGSALSSAFGGPLGIAIGGIAFAISQVGSQMSDLNLPTGDLSSAVDDLTHKVSALKLIEMMPADQVKALQDAKISVQEWAGALSGSKSDLESVRTKLLDYTAGQNANDESFAKGIDLMNSFGVELGKVGTVQDAATAKAKALNDALVAGFQDSDKGNAVANAQALASAFNTAAAATTAEGLAAGAAFGPAQALKQALWQHAEAANNAAGASDALTLSLQLLAGKDIDAETAARADAAAMRGISQAARDSADARQNVKDKTEELTKAQNKFGKGSDEAAAAQRALDDANARVAASSDAEAASFDSASKAAGVMTDQAYKHALATGHGIDAVNIAVGVMQQQRDEFIKGAIEAGHSADEAANLADKQGLIPANVRTHYEEVGLSVASDAVANLQKLIDAIPDKVTKELTIRAVVNIQTNNRQMRFDPATGQLVPMAAGGLWDNGHLTHAANGLDRQSMIAQGGANILWAEPETGWEAYISGKPSQLARNRGILSQTAARLGMGTYDLKSPVIAAQAPVLAASPFSQGGQSADIAAKLDQILAALRANGASTQIVQLGENVSVVHPAQDTETLDSKLFRLQSAIRI